MLTQPQVQRYSTESGLRDLMIAGEGSGADIPAFSFCRSAAFWTGWPSRAARACVKCF